MDARQPAPPPFQRPPDRHVIHNPNHQPQAQPYAGYPPPSSQPQQPLHVPFSPDPYATSRRDPFLPTSAQHVRRSSQGIHGGGNAPPAQAERQAGWTHTGTGYIFGFGFRHSSRAAPSLSRVFFRGSGQARVESYHCMLNRRAVCSFNHEATDVLGDCSCCVVTGSSVCSKS